MLGVGSAGVLLVGFDGGGGFLRGVTFGMIFLAIVGAMTTITSGFGMRISNAIVLFDCELEGDKLCAAVTISGSRSVFRDQRKCHVPRERQKFPQITRRWAQDRTGAGKKEREGETKHQTRRQNIS